MEKTFADLVRDRIDAAYSGKQIEFARATGFKPQTVNTWLRGKVTLPQIDARRRLARELGISHVELLVAMGELDEDEVAIPEDPRSPAVKRLQPLLDEIRWTPQTLRMVEDQLAFIRDAQRGALSPSTSSWELRDNSGIGITEFGEGGEPIRRKEPGKQET